MDWLSLLATLKQYSGLGIGLVGLAVITSQHWLHLLKGLKLPSFNPADAADPQADISDVEALHLLQARAKRSNCPQLKKAVRDVEVCFFNYVDGNAVTKAEAKP